MKFPICTFLTLYVILFASGTSAVSLKCVGCWSGVEVLRILYEGNATSTEIVRVANFICHHFADQDSFVCRGIISQFQKEFLYTLGQLVLQPRQLCGLLIRNCGTPFNPFGSNWTVPLPPKPEKPASWHPRFRHRHPNGNAPVRILQLSDIHYDPAYLEGAEADCAEPMCCIKKVLKPKRPAGFWGTVGKCDVPLRTVENLLEHINRTHKIDMAFLSGDYVHHRDWNYTREGHLDTISNISALVQRFLPNVPVFWSLGNHEGVPVNSFGPHFVPAKYRPEWMYRKILEEGHKTGGDLLPSSVDESAIYRGSYAVDLTPKLKLISFNNGYCSNTNMFIYINQTDPDGSLTWLVDRLWEAENASQSVYILAHIPPGNSECLESWSRNYYRIVIRFADTIRAQFFGHTHFEIFSLFFSDMDNPCSKPVSVLYAAPSVTTADRYNPAYRIYSANKYNWEVLDYETYFLNLSKADSGKSEKPPNWEFLYSAKSEYGLANLSPIEWNGLVRRIQNEPEIARKFNRNWARRDDLPCDEACLKGRICDILSSHHNEKALCGKGRNRTS